METGQIYSVICTITKQRYIGLTTQTLAKRWKEHITEAKKNPSTKLHRAIAKYGSHNFNIRVIEEDIQLDKLSEREQYWIEEFDTFNNGYNLTTGGETSKTIHEDVKEKISDTMLGVSKSEDHTNKVKETLTEKSVVEPWGALLPENRGDGIHARRKVRGTNIQTGEVVEFESLTAAGLWLGKGPGRAGLIRSSIKRNGSAYGYRWEYLSESVIRPVKGYGKWSGELVHEFDTVRQAQIALTGKPGTGCKKSLRNPGKSTWKGCYWYYA